jgi:hypothetical protein
VQQVLPVPLASTLLGFNAQTGTTYTLVVGDKDKIVTSSMPQPSPSPSHRQSLAPMTSSMSSKSAAGQVTFAAWRWRDDYL